SPYALDSVRRIARCGSSARWRARLCVLANSRYASSTTSSARPASLPAMRTIVGSSSRFPLGLFGEHRNTSLTSAVHCSSTARSSRANPAAARSGTVATCAPWMRAATAYIPNVGGHTSTASRPARQKARTRRSIASSLPRPARIDSGAAPYNAARGEAPQQRMRMGVQALELRERGGNRTEGTQACRRELLHRDALDEVEHRQAAMGPRVAVCRQHVVGSGAIITERLRRPCAEED